MRVSCSVLSRLGRARRNAFAFVVGLALATCIVPNVRAQGRADLVGQRAEYDANRPKTIQQLQPLRTTSTARLADGTLVRLISLNPGVNAWFVFETGSARAGDLKSYHLENPDPRGQRVALAPDGNLQLSGAGGNATCDLVSGQAPPILAARTSADPYAPLCAGRLYLRNPFRETSTNRDRSAAVLQARIWQGEALVQFDRQSFAGSALAAPPANPATGPAAARTDPTRARAEITARLGLGLAGAPDDRMRLGLWYPVAGIDGVFASAMRPEAIDPALLNGPGTANALDAVEARATDYFIAFDLSRYALGYALGTRAPGVTWSPRPPAAVRTPGLPGPDGIGNASPLVRLGMISPALTSRAVAVFTGGYKRLQGAFKYGAFAQKDAGTHYGFLQDGTIFSKLHAGLATLYGLTDGSIGMKTWTWADDALLPKLVFARQNGVPLVAPDPSTGIPLPTPYVREWGRANWSGSAAGKLRTERAGACLSDANGTTYLIYALFTTATPSAMARTFQAYGCRYAMLLDMNAPVLTYQALYVHFGPRIEVEHLVPSMAEADRRDAQGGALPRFLSYPDERDFFYLVRKGN